MMNIATNILFPIIILLAVTRLFKHLLRNLIWVNVFEKIIIFLDFRKELDLPQFNFETDLKDKIYVITGGTSGIGLELVETCFKNNATVVALIRDGKKGRQLFEDIRQKYPKSTGEIDSYYMDLSKMNTVMDAALYVIQNYRKVDVLINNGAIGTLTSHQLTTTGNELVMQTNYFGPLFLTLQLLPLIRSTKGRIISMSRFDKNFHRNTSEYSSVQAYANSKLAIVGMTIKLAELIDSDECTIVCASPGIVDTPISKYFTNAAFGPLWSDKLYPLTSYVTRRLFKSPHTASSQIMSLATIKNPNKFHGQYVSQHMITRVAKGRELFYEIWNDSFKSIGSSVFDEEEKIKSGAMCGDKLSVYYCLNPQYVLPFLAPKNMSKSGYHDQMHSMFERFDLMTFWKDSFKNHEIYQQLCRQPFDQMNAEDAIDFGNYMENQKAIIGRLRKCSELYNECISFMEKTIYQPKVHQPKILSTNSTDIVGPGTENKVETKKSSKKSLFDAFRNLMNKKKVMNYFGKKTGLFKKPKKEEIEMLSNDIDLFTISRKDLVIRQKDPIKNYMRARIVSNSMKSRVRNSSFYTRKEWFEKSSEETLTSSESESKPKKRDWPSRVQKNRIGKKKKFPIRQVNDAVFNEYMTRKTNKEKDLYITKFRNHKDGRKVIANTQNNLCDGRRHSFEVFEKHMFRKNVPINTLSEIKNPSTIVIPFRKWVSEDCIDQMTFNNEFEDIMKQAVNHLKKETSVDASSSSTEKSPVNVSSSSTKKTSVSTQIVTDKKQKSQHFLHNNVAKNPSPIFV